MRTRIAATLLGMGLSMIPGNAQPPPARKHLITDARDTPKAKPSESAAKTPAPPTPRPPTVQAAPPGPPLKHLTGQEFALVHVGSTDKEVLAALGPPSSRVVVPDDDGHLRESLQYWANGSPLGTVRLDNSRVVQIETKF